jgi:Tfp pilus assembly protein PilO
MRRIMVTIALVLALIFGYAVARSMADEMTAKSGETCEIKNLVGNSVKNPQGEDLGIIIDFVKDSNDRAVFAILVYGDYETYGDFGKQVAILRRTVLHGAKLHPECQQGQIGLCSHFCLEGGSGS